MMNFSSSRLRAWLASQAALGVGREALRLWAVGGGFDAAQVGAALDEVARAGGFDPGGSRATRMAESGFWRLSGDASCRLWMRCPELALLDGACPPEEAAAIMVAAGSKLGPSLVSGDGRAAPARGRASRSRTFASGECPAADALRARLASLLGVDQRRMEPLQATLYEPGGFYAPHFDHFPPGHPSAEGPSQRVATAVVYLSEPGEGGQTVIEPLGLRVAPRAGSVLYFAYPDEASRELCLHASAPCSGGKWVATQWIARG